MDKHYENIKNLILKHGDNIKGIHKNMYKEYLLSDKPDDQKEYIDTVLSQTEDNPKVAANIWGQEAVDYILKNVKENFNNMKLKTILVQMLNEQKHSSGLCKNIKEEQKVDPTYTHFALGKKDNKIVNGWDYKESDPMDIKSFSIMDLKDMDLDPKEYTIVSAKYLKSKGINPYDYKNWRGLN